MKNTAVLAVGTFSVNNIYIYIYTCFFFYLAGYLDYRQLINILLKLVCKRESKLD